MKNLLVIAEDPSFGAAANLVNALRQQGHHVRAVFKNKDPKGFWKTVEDPEYLTEGGKTKVRSEEIDTPSGKKKFVIMPHHIFIVGSSAWDMFAILANYKFTKPVATPTTVILTDTHYIRNHQRLNNEFAVAAATVFAMPDLYRYRHGLPTLPYYPPFDIDQYSTVKNEHFTVCHSPGPKAATNVKGTLDIRKVMAEFCRKHPDVEYMELSGLSHEETLRQKAKAHVFIDQMVPEGRMPNGYQGGLGKSGIEAMLLGCCVLTTMGENYDNDSFGIVPINLSKTDLETSIGMHYVFPGMCSRQQEQAKQYTNYAFVAKHIQQTTENVQQ